ncbi:MAG: EF-hand domain-containing protein [Pseudomonadales bacterium]
MEERLEELKEFFTDCDANSDGLIQLTEFSALLKNIGSDVTEDECRIGFAELDSDRDGRIDFNEFVNWWNER